MKPKSKRLSNVEESCRENKGDSSYDFSKLKQTLNETASPYDFSKLSKLLHVSKKAQEAWKEEGKKELLRVNEKLGGPFKVKKEEEGLMGLCMVAELLEDRISEVNSGVRHARFCSGIQHIFGLDLIPP